jgi:hypothetical protein
MKAIPLAYIARNLWVRRVTTALTAGGMALVVYVFATVLMMTEGIRATLVATGQPDNVMVLRQGAGAEINSAIERGQAAVLSTLPGIATDALGRPLLSAETVVLINLPKRSNGKPSNVTVRGTSATGLQLRPGVRIVEGRMFRPGTSEIVVGSSTASGFAGIDIGALARQGSRIGGPMPPGVLPPQEPALRIFVTLDMPQGSLRRLVDQAERAGAVLVLWSARSVESDWVLYEAARGRDLRKLVPATLDGTPAPLGFRQYQTIDLASWRTGHDDVRRRLGHVAHVPGSGHCAAGDRPVVGLSQSQLAEFHPPRTARRGDHDVAVLRRDDRSSRVRHRR